MRPIKQSALLIALLLAILFCGSCESYNSLEDVYKNGKKSEQISYAIEHRLFTPYGFEETTNSKFRIKEKAHNINEAYFDDVCYDYYLSDYGVCGNMERKINGYDIRITIYYDKKQYWIELKNEKLLYSTFLTFSFQPVKEKESISDWFIPVEEMNNEQSYNQILQCVSKEEIQNLINDFDCFTNDLLYNIYVG